MRTLPPTSPPARTHRRRAAVLGGGIAGIAVAAELADSGVYEVDLIEGAPRLGGLHRSLDVGGLHYDIGAFFYDAAHPLFDLFPFLRDTCVRVAGRHLSVTPAGTLDRYPLTLRGYVRDHGRARTAAAIADLAWCKWACRRRASLPDHLAYYLGRRMYVQSGLKTYIERLFGLPDVEIGLEFARYRLAKVASACSWRGTAGRLVRGRTAVAEVLSPYGYVRPKLGFAAMYGPVAEALRQRGVRVRTGARIDEARRAGAVHELSVDGTVERYDDVVSTIPIPTLARLAGMERPAAVETRSLFSLFYRHSGGLRHDATYLYNFNPAGRWKRMTTFSAMYGRERGDAWFTVEGTLEAGCGEEALDACRHDLEKTAAGFGLFDGTPEYQGGVVTANAYPIYRPDDGPALDAARGALRDRGFVLVGRQGAFDYLGSGTIAANARRTARELVEQHAPQL
ncbi:MAG TPA: FAD-dependent oxidoreductase [Longimicrobium sp.]|jgi:hypothetical protein|nr:FAD-dependent oxidoreductase [Longimicrobium sp.]